MVIETKSEREVVVETMEVMGESRDLWAKKTEEYVNGKGRPVKIIMFEGYTKEEVIETLELETPKMLENLDKRESDINKALENLAQEKEEFEKYKKQFEQLKAVSK